MTIKPLFATEKHTADLLDMPKSTFRDLVATGDLPGPVVIGGQERWDVETLTRVLRGELVYEERPSW